MKKILLAVIAAAIVIVAGVVWAMNGLRTAPQTSSSSSQMSTSSTSGSGSGTGSNQKTLIVYYSRTGNTRAVAELIQNQVGGDLFQIETKVPRPKNYRAEVNQNEQEQSDNTLPVLKSKVPNFASYDRVFIGSPTWNMALPQAVVTFLDSYNFSGKTVIPFNTNGGYGVGSVFTQIRSGAKNADRVLQGFSVEGGQETNGILLAIKGNRRVQVSKEVDSWLSRIGQNRK
ncbi:flavodoxin [Oenococcus kitaharae]|uniref:Flavodoxin n=1 Tax=Oenococcus kitaharae DSM 17330 TaxID=1045004 RepID=G9WGW4_9LACO|nr:Flavodoxin [Oenococcus kitaharae DSM 17330]OEY83255.1 flavodoxin [Oenococcus kitaharae]OEY85053.1 flavodoxin [Oenococcus kitaharae]OEY85908.1 flavodoxin [Oenococcus kitaharae]